MKRLFSVFISQTTHLLSKIFGGKSGAKEPPLQEPAQPSPTPIEESAKEIANLSPAQIQAAKDFIWKWMDETNRGLIVGMATLSTHERHGLYIKQIFAEMEANGQPGETFRERMIIGLQYNHQPSHSSQTA